MSVSIDIHTFSHTLDMYGDPDTSSAYSLSGQVSISLSSPSSLFGSRRRAVRLLLQSLTITFEGQSEVITQEFGYAPLRLCSLARDLAPSESMELTNEGHEDSDKPCTWNFLFNLIVPGWLPATATFGDLSEEDAGTCYALFATAKFVTLDDNCDKTWSLSTLCSAFQPRTRAVHAQKCTIILRRFMNPPSAPFSSTSLFSMSNYTISAKCEHTDATDSPSIPLDILSKIQVVASVPDYLSTDEASVPFVIRLRTVDLEDAQCKRLRVTCFRIDVKQTEKYRGLPSSEYASRYLVPPSSAQPPNEPLLAPHSFHALYESGLVDASVSLHQTVARSFSVMHPAQFGDYQIAGDGYIFSDDYNCREMPTWYTIHGGVKLSRSSSRSCQLRVSGNSPLFGVRHEVHVSLTCVYDTPETSEPVTEQLNFSVPLRFVHVTPRPLSRDTSPSPSLTTPDLSSFISSTEPAPEAEMLTSGLPYAHSLPAYSQLFDSNGDRHIDYSIPLPVYTPHTLPSPDHCEFDAGGGGGKSVFL